MSSGTEYLPVQEVLAVSNVLLNSTPGTHGVEAKQHSVHCQHHLFKRRWRIREVADFLKGSEVDLLSCQPAPAVSAMVIIAAARGAEGGGAAGRTEDGGATADGAAAEDATADGDMGKGAATPGAAEVESLTARGGSVSTEILTLFCQVNHQLCRTS